MKAPAKGGAETNPQNVELHSCVRLRVLLNLRAVFDVYHGRSAVIGAERDGAKFSLP
jgi:hypothetical protein